MENKEQGMPVSAIWKGDNMKYERNKYLCIFPNFKETVDNMPQKYQGATWKLIIDYAFGGEEAVEKELEISHRYVKMAFLSIKPLLELRKKAGSQGGKSNNPSGLSKTEQANIGPNLGAIPYTKEKNISEIEDKEKEREREIERIYDAVIKKVPGSPFDY